MTNLLHKHCVPCEGGVPPLTSEQIAEYLPQVPGWAVDKHNQKIHKTFSFKNFHETMAFVNKIADIANAEDHHPDLHVSYSKATVELWTHAIGGLSDNDFIVAAKVDAL